MLFLCEQVFKDAPSHRDGALYYVEIYVFYIL